MEFPSKDTLTTMGRYAVPVVLGSLAGYAYYYFIGCHGGTCPITGNPWISTAYGALIGFTLTPRRKRPAEIEKSGGTS